MTNSPEAIHELASDGSLIRSISLPLSIGDTEGVAHLGGSRFAILEEGERNVVVMDMGEVSSGNTISIGDLNVFSLDVAGSENSGLEGIAYDSASDTMYVTREKETPRIFRFSLSGAMAGGAASPYPVTAFPATIAGLSDLSGLHFDSASGSLLVSSHESQRLVEFATAGPNAGEELSSISLDSISQAEGVTIGPGGEIYVVGEPNLLYTFSSNIPEPSATLLLIAAATFTSFRRRL